MFIEKKKRSVNIFSAREREMREMIALSNLSISLPETEEREERHAKKTRARGIQKAERRNKKRRLTSDFNSGSGFSAAAVAEDGLLAALLLLSAATTLMFLLLDDDFCANCLLDKDLVVERTTEDAMRALDEDEQQANALDIFVLCFLCFECSTRALLVARETKSGEMLCGEHSSFSIFREIFSHAGHLGFTLYATKTLNSKEVKVVGKKLIRTDDDKDTSSRKEMSS